MGFFKKSVHQNISLKPLGSCKNMNCSKLSSSSKPAFLKTLTTKTLSMMLLVMVGSTTLHSSAQAQTNTESKFYGTGIAATSLANYQIGESSDRRLSIRFRADHSGEINQFRAFWKYSSSGYFAGNGGLIRVTLRTDDGTEAHNPSSNVIGSTIIQPDVSRSGGFRFKDLPLTSPGYVEQGQLYHLHFQNIASNKARNWISINSIFNHQRDSSVVQPTTSDWALLNQVAENGDSWNVVQGFSPILTLHYSSGKEQGMGYMEFWSAKSGFKATESNKMRQTMTPSKELRIKGLNISAGRYYGNGDLIATLKNSDGTTIDTATLSSGSFPQATGSSSCPRGLSGDRCHVWSAANFSNVQTLQSGNTYYLEFSTSSGSEYRFNIPRDGSIQYGFSTSTVFNDGHAEISSNGGASWRGVSQWGSSDRQDGDLEFYLELE
jgi:hypothetical protein